MLSNNANYNMNDALAEINEKEQILNAKIDSQVVLQLLVQKGIATREEVQEMRNKVSNSPKYKATREYLESAKKKAQQYRDDPQAHLRDLFNAKLNGQL